LSRYALNIKGLPYKTVWVEYPDIALLCQEIGAAPTLTRHSTAPRYTLPVIHDASTGAVVSDSFQIARYLDKTYPSTTQLIPLGTSGLLQAACETLGPLLPYAIYPAIVLNTAEALAPRSSEYFHATRSKSQGKPLAEICPPGAAQDDVWTICERGLEKIAKWLDDEPGMFMMGEHVSFTDVYIASALVWIRCSADQGRWEQILGWHDGRWANFMEMFDRWGQVDEGCPYGL
jgi:glutathione S-transferase